MPTLAQLDHLISVLGRAVWEGVGRSVDLRMANGGAEDREAMLAADSEHWGAVEADTIWGEPQRYFWFRGVVDVPEPEAGRDLWLRIDAQFGRVMGRSDPQCLVRINGEIVQGADFNHRHVPLRGSGLTDIMIEAGTIEDRCQLGFAVEIVSRDFEAEALYFDLFTAMDVARHLPENDHRRDFILTTVYEALNALDLRAGNRARRVESVVEARSIAARIYRSQDAEAQPTIVVTGHTHIDVAWLWRVRETRQKIARSVATALNIMHDYPDYLFMYNQGFLLDTLQQDYPELFDALKDRHQSGQVEIEGALWLEPDANMTGGEALVRHLTKGIRYHRETFGVDPKVVWLPDTFGYSSALPQLMKLAGQEVFVTHKMSWNDTNRMPHEMFWWQGLDGTRVPTYFLTTQPMESTSKGTTYCPDLRPSHVMGAWRRFSQKDTSDRLWLCYGHGDGGGGPTREMVEMLRRMEAGIPGCPRVEHGTMGAYFADFVRDMHDAPERFPSWVGELYAEFHRGTFTSVAEVKRNNRRGEAALRRIEYLAVLALLKKREAYPSDALNRLWDTVLLNQFHDILPGSSIEEVYLDSRAEFDAFFEEAATLEAHLREVLGGGVFNPFGHEAGGLVQVEEGGQSLSHPDGTTSRAMLVEPQFAAISTLIERHPSEPLDVSRSHLENAQVCARFDEKGRLVSFFDKVRRQEVLKSPVTLDAYRDLPAQFDAWDIDETYQDQSWPIDDLVSAEVVETGPVRSAIRFEWAYEASRFVQVVSLTSDGSVLEFDTYVDWREKNTLVKASFPFDLTVSEVIAETQFGHVARPTHRNTSWDMARFEHPMLRWVAMAELDRGAAVLNDCKYGYDAQGSTLRVSLLRAPTWPWDGADIGGHRFRYGLAPIGNVRDVPRLADVFNDPLQTHGQGSEVHSLLTLPDGIALEAVKLADEGGDIIVRLCERYGRRQEVEIGFSDDITGVCEADLLEVCGAEVSGPLRFRAFEIKTLRLTWEGSEWREK